MRGQRQCGGACIIPYTSFRTSRSDHIWLATASLLMVSPYARTPNAERNRKVGIPESTLSAGGTEADSAGSRADITREQTPALGGLQGRPGGRGFRAEKSSSALFPLAVSFKRQFASMSRALRHSPWRQPGLFVTEADGRIKQQPEVIPALLRVCTRVKSLSSESFETPKA